MRLRFLFPFLCCLFCVAFTAFGSENASIRMEQHRQVALRLLGHRILLNFGDSTSRVLPIQKLGKGYKIAFASEFNFEPGGLIQLIDATVKETQLAKGYLIEVVDCSSKEVVYSFEMNARADLSVLPCGSRTSVKACYEVIFTPDNEGSAEVLPLKVTPAKKIESASTGKSILILGLSIAVLSLLAWFAWSRKRKVNRSNELEFIALGSFQFDSTNMVLIHNDDRIDLTGKENELLQLLYEAQNVTVERQEILNAVWGDEGDYVGRTLDVFISKLRKKLEADARIKIINIRGVGYKLVLNP